ncbi:hypothetical protein DFH06DRAFT_1150057 [Mycena polygramma]|nr:hypothetical protein DFH06DRAFT_1150057 [Mycena polygramma]
MSSVPELSMSGGARSLPKVVGDFRPTAASRRALTELFGAWIRTPMFGFVSGWFDCSAVIRSGVLRSNPSERKTVEKPAFATTVFNASTHQLATRDVAPHAWPRSMPDLKPLYKYTGTRVGGSLLLGNQSKTPVREWCRTTERRTPGVRRTTFVDLEHPCQVYRTPQIARARGGARCNCKLAGCCIRAARHGIGVIASVLGVGMMQTDRLGTAAPAVPSADLFISTVKQPELGSRLRRLNIGRHVTEAAPPRGGTRRPLTSTVTEHPRSSTAPAPRTCLTNIYGLAHKYICWSAHEYIQGEFVEKWDV